MKSKNNFNYSISVSEGLDTTASFIPGMILQPFVENCIKHGVANNEKKDGMIKILFSKNDRLICIVEDNGIGRENAGKVKIARNDEYVSKGMSITMSRIDTINKIYDADISVLITDINDEQDNPAGTCVRIEFPLNMD